MGSVNKRWNGIVEQRNGQCKQTIARITLYGHIT